MDILILKDYVYSNPKGWSAVQGIRLPDGRFMVPKRVLTEPSLQEAVPEINEKLDTESEVLPLPDSGTITEGSIYQWDDPDLSPDEQPSNLFVCRQTHERTVYKPTETPALFISLNTDEGILGWIPMEQVIVGDIRLYNEVKYECIQAHVTQSDWTPDSTPTLWKVYEEPGGEYSVWVQPTGGHDAYNTGDIVWFPEEDTTLYRSLIDANVWSPTVYPAGWEVYTP
jgi:hypothetical protein